MHGFSRFSSSETSHVVSSSSDVNGGASSCNKTTMMVAYPTRPRTPLILAVSFQPSCVAREWTQYENTDVVHDRRLTAALSPIIGAKHFKLLTAYSRSKIQKITGNVVSLPNTSDS